MTDGMELYDNERKLRALEADRQAQRDYDRAVERLLTNVEQQNAQRRLNAARAAVMEVTRDVWDWTSRAKVQAKLETYAKTHGWEKTLERVASHPQDFGSLRGFGKLQARQHALSRAKVPENIMKHGDRNAPDLFRHDMSQVKAAMAHRKETEQAREGIMEPFLRNITQEIERLREEQLERSRSLGKDHDRSRGRGRDYGIER